MFNLDHGEYVEYKSKGSWTAQQAERITHLE